MFYQASRAQIFDFSEVWGIQCTVRRSNRSLLPVRFTVSCALTIVCRFYNIGCTLRSSVITVSSLYLYSIMCSSDYWLYGRLCTYRGLPILYGELYSDLEPLPLSGGLRNVLSHLLGGQAKGTNLVTGHGVTKRCRLSWLTNSTLVYEPKCGGGGELRVLSQWVQLYSWSPHKFLKSNSFLILWRPGLS